MHAFGFALYCSQIQACEYPPQLARAYDQCQTLPQSHTWQEAVVEYYLSLISVVVEHCQGCNKMHLYRVRVESCQANLVAIHFEW